jgi:hypothetical protein
VPRRSADNPLGRYILDGTEAIPWPYEAPDPAWLAWAYWFEGEHNRLVAWDEVTEGVSVSTIFLGLDHQWGNGPPMLFETMTFGPYGGGEQYRYPTWDDAWAGHHTVLKRLQETVKKLGLPEVPVSSEEAEQGHNGEA